MLVSMTGYCSLNEQITLASNQTINLSLELKTFNSRFFELSAKLPSPLSSLEMSFNTAVQEKLLRGRAYLTITFPSGQEQTQKIMPSWPVVDQYVAGAAKIKERHTLAGDLTLSDILGLPDVFVTEELILTMEDKKLFIDLVRKASEMVAKMRIEEGSRLEKDFEKAFAICGSKIQIIEKAFAQELERHKALVKEELEKHPISTTQPNAHLEEMQTQLRKIDIHEEITRFKSHLAGINTLLSAKDLEKGKRLDFTLQELMRETNTMMAKCQTYLVSAPCIDIKVELEKAREQIQNIV